MGRYETVSADRALVGDHLSPMKILALALAKRPGAALKRYGVIEIERQ